MSTPDLPPFDPPAVYCRHLLLCRTIWYDPAKPDEGYSLGRLVTDLRPPDGVAGPFVVPRLFAYVQLHGDLGDYDVRLRLVEVTMDEDGDEVEQFAQEWGPWLLPVSGLELVDSHGLVMADAEFARPGIYSVQLWLDGIDEPLAAERVRIIQPVQEMP